VNTYRARRTPRPCSMCGSLRLCRRCERRLIGSRFGRWREEIFGRARCLTLRYTLLLSVWVDPSAEHRKHLADARDLRESARPYISELVDAKRLTGHTHTHTTAEQTTHTNIERATAQRSARRDITCRMRDTSGKVRPNT